MSEWYTERGPESDIIVSSRIRLARNFRNYPFPHRMNKEQEQKVIQDSKVALINDRNPMSKDFMFIDLPKMEFVEKQTLVEKHLISPDMVSSGKNNGLLLSKDEKVSIMVNEEDHLRIQCLNPGLQLDKTLELGMKVDGIFENSIEYAFHNELGYLTCCPTNLGTGMRASVMMHLPALTITGYISGILEAVGKIGIAVRGLYGENTEAAGNMFQVSNQVTLGQSEQEIISNLNNIISQIMEKERDVRSELYKQNRLRIEDRIFRSYGTLTNARILSSEECMKLISDVSLGIHMGIIQDIPIETFYELMVKTQPANLQKSEGRLLTPDERDTLRADLIRSRLYR